MQNSGPRQRTSRHIPAMWHRIFSGLMAVILTLQMALSPVTALGADANSGSAGSSSSQTGWVEVSNFFKDQPDGETYPDLTFVLYRKDPDNSSLWTQVASKTITASDYNAWLGMVATFKFENLDAYTPSGAAYEYQVVQLTRDSYTTYSKKATGDSYLVSNEVSGLYVTNTTGSKYEYEAIFYNEYTPKTVTIAGSVDWQDNDNAWNTRADIYDNLVLTRSHEDGSDTQEVPLQQSQSSAYNYFQWTSSTTWVDSYKSGSNYTSFSISNLEKYSYDGRDWVYSLKQDDSKVAADSTLNQYELTTGQLTGTGDLAVTLTNTLKSTATATVTFEDDGDDAYQQRPRVYVELQASTDGGQTWAAAASVLGFGGINGNLFEQVWTPSAGTNQMTYTWDQLPTTSNNEFLTASNIIYRAKESKLAYDSTRVAGTEYQVVTTKVDKDGNYAASMMGVYKPSQTTVMSDCLSATTITNKPKSNSTYTMFITNKWNDGGAKWLRPSTVTYLLQRKTAGGDWEWVTKYNAGAGSPFDVYGTSLNDSLVQLTLSETDAEEGELSNNWGKTLENLPAVDVNDSAYTYRAVEVVPTGYHVTSEGATEVTSNDSFKLYAVGDGDAIFENTTDKDTISLFGIVRWEKQGFDRPDPSSLDIQLLQYKGQDDANPTSIPLEQTSFQWTSSSSDRWQYKIDGLPTTADDGTAYYYKVVQTPGSAAGYRTTNPSGFAAYYEGELYGGAIVNAATRLALDKVGTVGGQTTRLNDVELTIKDASGNVAAVWYRDSQGKVTVTSNNGYTWASFVGSDVTHIFGLPAGTYTVSETKTPANYLTAPDVQMTIAVDGTVSTTSSNATATDSGDSDGVAADLLTVRDEALRGGFDVTLTAGEGDDEAPVEGMAFDLYKSDGTLLATGLTTDEKGVFTSATSDVAYEAEAGLGANYVKLSDGLPQGGYYLVETGEKADIVIPTGDDAKAQFYITANGDATQQPAAQHVTVNNKLFSASVYLTKADVTAESFEAIAGATFELAYKAPGASEYVTVQTLTTDEDGEVWFKGLKKGSYTLTEVSNPGYNVGENGLKALDFVIANDDADQDRNLGDAADRSSVEATNVDQSIIDYECLVNERLTGAVTMKKVDENGKGIAGAVFKLQVKGAGDAWTDVEGKTELVSAADGTVTASGLAWGTYRFAEVSQAPGFVASGSEVSGEATIGRDNVATAQDCGAVTNYGVSLTLKKAYADVNLKGAEFAVVPATGSAFADGTVGEKTFTTGDDGTVTLLGILAVGNTYTIKESAAPKGYKLGADELTIKVGEGGAIEVVGDEPAAFDVDGTTVTMQDEPTTFSVTKVDENSDPLAGASFKLIGSFADGSSSQTLTTDKNGAAALTGLLKADGTTVYTLRETAAPKGYTLNLNKLQFTVGVDGTIALKGEAPEGYELATGGASVVSTDAAIVPVTATISVSKVVEGGTSQVASQAFCFQLRDYTGAHTPGWLLQTVDGVKAGDTASFEAITYTKPGVYRYLIHEKGDGLGLGWTLAADQYVEVTVLQNEDLSLQTPTVKYGSSAYATSAVFTNRYTAASGSFQLGVKKTVNGNVPKEGQNFEFSAAATGSNAADAPQLDNVVTGDDGTASFSAVSLGDADEGQTYTYTIHEVTQLASGWTAAPDVTATVAVGTRDASGKLPVTVTYDGASADVATFNNTYAAAGELKVNVTATVNGGEWEPDREFEFGLFEADANGEKTGQPVSTVKVKAGQAATFEGVTYDEGDEGQVTYVVSELGEAGDGWTYAADQAVDVTVADNGDGTMTAAVSYPEGKTALAFDNAYVAAATIGVKKTVNGGQLNEGESFSFSLYEEGNDGAEKIGSAAVGAQSPTAAFDAVTFTKPGTYTYTVSEDANPDANWMNADDVAVTFQVTEVKGEDGQVTGLLATLVEQQGGASDYSRVSRGSDGSYTVSFNNAYYSEATAVLKARAEVTGATEAVASKEFKFELKDASGQVIDTKTAKAGEAVAFDALSYTRNMRGAHTYTIAVQAADGDAANWTFQGDAAATVTVGMDAENRRVVVQGIAYARDGADCSYAETDGSKSALFTSTYTAPVNPDDPDEPVNPDDPDDPVNPDEPDEPVNPDEPDDPDTPDTPDNPDEPDTPDTPDTPDMPDNPDEPETPKAPEQPEAPATPETPAATPAAPAAKKAQVGTPQTGDASTSVLLALTPAAVFLAAAALFRRRRN